LALIPIISYKGSAIATLAAYGSMMVISYFLGQRNYAVPYDLKKIGGYLMLSVGFSALSFYVFDGNLVIGTALLLVFLLWIIIAEKNQLKRLLKR
jgi:O-antigen/teichoic acid export membrane protein